MKLASASHILMSRGCAHPVDHCMSAHRVDHWMYAPSGPLDVCICITTTCNHPRAHRKRYIRGSTRDSYIWWTTSSPLVVIRMQRHLVDHWMCKSPVYYVDACVKLNARTAPVAFAPRRVSHVVFLISLVLEQTSEDCIGNTEHSNINVNDECNSK